MDNNRDIRDELDMPLILYMIKKMGYSFKLSTGMDFAHDVYLECLKNEKYYTEDRNLSTFVKLQIRNLIFSQYKLKKDIAKTEAVNEEFFEETMMGTSDKVEAQILLEELKPHLSIEMWYYLKDPMTPDFSFDRNSIHRLGEGAAYMTCERIGEILGVHRNCVHTRIYRNRKKLEKMI